MTVDSIELHESWGWPFQPGYLCEGPLGRTGMINLARSEMRRDPLVWWSFAAAFGFMVTIVLAVNLRADEVQRAFDPRAVPRN